MKNYFRIDQGKSHSGRRTFAGKVLKETGDIRLVARLLGHEEDDIDVTARYVDVDHKVLTAMFKNAV